jgi:hypothetical protein
VDRLADRQVYPSASEILHRQRGRQPAAWDRASSLEGLWRKNGERPPIKPFGNFVRPRDISPVHKSHIRRHGGSRVGFETGDS